MAILQVHGTQGQINRIEKAIEERFDVEYYEGEDDEGGEMAICSIVRNRKKR